MSTSSNKGIKTLIGGGASPLRSRTDTSSTDVPNFLDVLTEFKIEYIDSAVAYGDSEALLGEFGAGERFVIDSKVPGGLKPGTATQEGVVQTGQQSLEKLKIKQINIYYIHAPDESIPLESTLAGINDLHQQGVFREFGLSNYTPEQVQKVYDHCKENGYVLPTVYQGNYNAFARTYETTLLPLLRSLGISFNAYSPQAGGFLSKTLSALESAAGTHGRFDSVNNPMLADMYTTLYKKPSLLKGLTQWNEIASSINITPSAMAIRWVKYNSALNQKSNDGIIVGPGRTLETMRETLEACEAGPLDDQTARKIDELWELVKDEAPVDNYHDFVKKTSSSKK